MDEIRLVGIRAATKYLKKKNRQKQIKKDIITGLILLAAFLLLVIFYPKF